MPFMELGIGWLFISLITLVYELFDDGFLPAPLSFELILGLLKGIKNSSSYAPGYYAKTYFRDLFFFKGSS